MNQKKYVIERVQETQLVTCDLELYPDSFTEEETLGGEHAEKWKKAMLDEFCSLVSSNIWSLVERREGIVGCTYFLWTVNDEVGKVKSWLVAKGYTQ